MAFLFVGMSTVYLATNEVFFLCYLYREMYMYKWLDSLLKIFKRKPPVLVLSEVELIKAERQKRMPFLGTNYWQGDTHIMCMGPGHKLSNQTHKAIAKGHATEIPETHPAIID